MIDLEFILFNIVLNGFRLESFVHFVLIYFNIFYSHFYCFLYVCVAGKAIYTKINLRSDLNDILIYFKKIFYFYYETLNFYH
jgi:hypothetical protein